MNVNKPTQKEKTNKWSIQISHDLAKFLKLFCKENGYTMNGFVEGAVKERLSGSYEK